MTLAKTISSFLITFLFVTSSLIAQTCPDLPVLITSQEQIDNFATIFPGCTEFDVGILIESDDENGIVNLHGLIQIEEINGNLVISRNEELYDLSGLDSLKKVEGYISIHENPQLNNLHGLNSLQVIGGEGLIITRNDQLESLGFASLTAFEGSTISHNNGLVNLTGFISLEEAYSINILENENLENVNAFPVLHTLSSFSFYGNKNLKSIKGLGSLESFLGSIFIFGNDVLNNLSGFSHLRNINGSLHISYNQGLSTLAGFDALAVIGNFFIIEYNASLASLNGLDSLTTVGSLILSNNNSLVDLQGLEQVERILYQVEICDNTNLQSLKGLEGVDLQSLNTMVVTDNEKLTECATNAICNYIGNCKDIEIFDNGSDECNAVADLELVCMNQTDFSYEIKCVHGVFPNPTHQYLKLQFNNKKLLPLMEFEILDMQGRFLRKVSIPPILDVSELVRGTYFLRVKLNDYVEVFPFVKE